MQPTHRAADDLEAQRLALRAQFLLRPDVIFLNHGSFGACPRPVFQAYQAWQLELEREPVEFLGRRFTDLLRHAREALAAYVGAAPDELAYVPNATGLNIVARSLPLQAGDEVLATDHEYGALDRTWRFVCRRRGARYINQTLLPPLESPKQVVETLWSAVIERTRVLLLSHITSPTALILPVAELVRRARQAGILTVVDGAHAPGQISLDLTALGAGAGGVSRTAARDEAAHRGAWAQHAAPLREQKPGPYALPGLAGVVRADGVLPPAAMRCGRAAAPAVRRVPRRGAGH
jgi:isopenicillin-N epimerase